MWAAAWHPDDVLALPDGSERSFRELRYTGPGAVFSAWRTNGAAGTPRHRHGRWMPAAARTTLVVRRGEAGRASPTPEVILLEPGATLRVRGAPDRSA